MINPADFSFPESTRENPHVTMAEEYRYLEIVRDFVQVENASDLIDSHKRFYSSHVSRKAQDRGQIITNVVSLAALIVARDPTYERAVYHLPEAARRGARRMKPLWLASRILIDKKQNWHNYAQAAAEVLHRRVNLSEVVELFSKGELDLSELRASYIRRTAKHPKRVAAAIKLLGEPENDKSSSTPDVEGTEATDEMSAPCGASLAQAAGPVVPEEMSTAQPDEPSREPAAHGHGHHVEALDESQVLLRIPSSKLRMALTPGQHYLAEFTLSEVGTGLVTLLRPAAMRMTLRTVPVTPKPGRL